MDNPPIESSGDPPAAPLEREQEEERDSWLPPPEEQEEEEEEKEEREEEKEREEHEDGESDGVVPRGSSTPVEQQDAAPEAVHFEELEPRIAAPKIHKTGPASSPSSGEPTGRPRGVSWDTNVVDTPRARPRKPIRSAISERKQSTWGRLSGPLSSTLRRTTSVPAESNRPRRTGRALSGRLSGLIQRLPSQAVLFAQDTFGKAATLVTENINTDNSPFKHWPRWAIQEQLVAEDVEVIGARFLSEENWLEIITEYFKTKWEEAQFAQMPPMPVERSPEETSARLAAALRIQDAWWSYKKRLRSAADEKVANAIQEASLAPQMMEAQEAALAQRPLQPGNSMSIMQGAAWVAPDLDLAHRYVDSMHPRNPSGDPFKLLGANASSTGRYCMEDGWGEQCDLWNEGYVSDFAVYGSGITNYFKFIKWCAWVFLVLSILHLPHIVINSNGEGFTVSNGLDRISLTTIGNLGSQPNATSELPDCDRAVSDLNGIDCTVEKDRLGDFYEGTDVLVAIFFAAAWFWLLSFHGQEAQFVDCYTVTAADYSVFVPRVPAGTTSAMLRAHFAKALGMPIADVSVALDQRALFKNFKTRGKAIIDRQRTAEKLKYIYTFYNDESCGMAMLKLRREGLEKRCNKLRTSIEEFNRSLQHDQQTAGAVCAYVTFQKADQRARAIYAYQVPLWKRLLAWCGCYPRKLLYEDPETGRKRVLQVLPAPDPSTIVWENQGTPFLEKVFFRTLTTLVALGMVAAVVFISACSVWYQKEQIDTDEDLEECLDFEDLSDGEQLQAALGDRDLIPCYCEQYNWWSVGGADDRLRDDCIVYLRDQSLSSFVQALVSATASFFGLAFNFVIKYMGAFEGHVSHDGAAWTVFLRLFVLKFVTLGLVVLLVHLDQVVNALPPQLQYETQAFFDTAWFVQSGTQVIMTMLVTSFGTHVISFIKFCRRARAQDRAEKGRFSEAGIYTQEHLNASLMGGHFFFYERYAELLSFFFICFMYGAGMPILYPIGFGGCAIFYMVDKFMFARFYREPPRYSEKIGKAAIDLLPLALGFHLLLSIWMLGGAPVFQSETEDSPVQMARNRPLLGITFVFVSVFIVGRFLRKELGDVARCAVDALPFLSCFRWCCIDLNVFSETVVSVSYDRAKLRGQMQGLAGYHVLQNPVYREAFGLGIGFRSRRRTGNSMRLESDTDRIVETIQRDMDRVDEELAYAKRSLTTEQGHPVHQQMSRVGSTSPNARAFPGTAASDASLGGGLNSRRDLSQYQRGISMRQVSRQRLQGLYRRPELRYRGRSVMDVETSPSAQHMEFSSGIPMHARRDTPFTEARKRNESEKLAEDEMVLRRLGGHLEDFEESYEDERYDDRYN